MNERLTPREAEVLAEVRHGRCSKEIATHLAISEATVNWHMKNVLVKLDAQSRAHAVAIAIDAGLLESSQGLQGPLDTSTRAVGEDADEVGSLSMNCSG